MPHAPRTLRSQRESTGLSPDQLAARARCPVRIVLDVEAGVRIPGEKEVRERLAGAYDLAIADFIRLALDAAELWEDESWHHPRAP